MRLALGGCVWTVVAGALLGGCTPETNVRTFTPEVAVQPEALDFGELVANEETAELEVFVSNGGEANLDADLALTGSPAFSIVAGKDHLEVKPDGSATIMIAYAPTDLALHEATLVVSTNDPDLPEIDIPITGTGRVPYAPDIDIQPPGALVFSNVSQGVEFTQVVTLLNVGDADLLIEGIAQTGAGTFTIEDPTGLTIAPGQNRPMFVKYKPVLPDQGDSGSVTIFSNDPDEPEVTVNFEGNGGGDFQYPVAVIDCPGVVDLAGPKVVDLDGSGSYDPFGGTLTYKWSTTLRPVGADPDRAPEPVDQPQTSVLIDAAGDWIVELVVSTVVDGVTIPSVPARCEIEAIPTDQIHVELAWGGPTSDLDLHVALDDAPLYSTPGDVSWCNTNPDWGVLGDPDDDGRLDQDDDDGLGPENVNVFEPVEGTYNVRVHMFDDGIDGATTAEVQVFLYGELEWSGYITLERNQVWEVGQINWPEGTFADDESVWDAAGLRECE
jgi:hypothetical protein